MKVHSPVFLTSFAVSFFVSTSAFAFSGGFDWGNIPKCTSGNPGTVPSPKFTLNQVPEGTVKLKFNLADLNVTYNHGGGTVAYGGSGTIPAGSFKYQSPCPPDGFHNYQWTITAIDGKGKKLGTLKLKKRYP